MFKGWVSWGAGYLFSIAANQGSAIAQYHLALKRYTGEEWPKDYAEAAKWYLKAAEQGYAEAHKLSRV